METQTLLTAMDGMWMESSKKTRWTRNGQHGHSGELMMLRQHIDHRFVCEWRAVLCVIRVNSTFGLTFELLQERERERWMQAAKRDLACLIPNNCKLKWYRVYRCAFPFHSFRFRASFVPSARCTSCHFNVCLKCFLCIFCIVFCECEGVEITIAHLKWYSRSGSSGG